MRKTITTLLALGAIAAGAQPVAAAVPPGDDPEAVFTDIADYGTGVTQGCSTSYKEGVPGEGGAWGSFISGCTVKLECPATKNACLAVAYSRIFTEHEIGDRVSLNSRTRMFDPGADTTGRWRDYSCAGIDWCAAQDRVEIKGGESASVQCNGVRATAANRAHVKCTLDLQYL
jgi:hypothetical protein